MTREREIFRRKKNDTSHYALGVTLGHRTIHKGEVGIEVEVEGKKLKKSGLPKAWVYHEDGSLRGEENAEYVLAKPMMFDLSLDAVDELYGMFKEAGSVLDDSNRTSVHVHLNVQNFFLNRLAAFMGMYFTFEEILSEWCGEHRVGNLFCLRAKDAPAIISQIARFINTDCTSQLSANVHHYAALNASAIPKLGSVELRTLRGCSEAATIKEWVGILRRLYELSSAYPDPRELISGKFSGEGPLMFFEDILGEHARIIRRDVPWSEEQIRESLYEGMRMAQDICYARDWSMYKPTEYTPDPFGRTPRKKKSSYLSLGDDMEMPEPDWDNFIPAPEPAPPQGADTIVIQPGQTLDQAMSQQAQQATEAIHSQWLNTLASSSQGAWSTGTFTATVAGTAVTNNGDANGIDHG